MSIQNFRDLIVILCVFVFVPFSLYFGCSNTTTLLTGEDYYYTGRTIGEPLSEEFSIEYPGMFPYVITALTDFRKCYIEKKCIIDALLTESLDSFMTVSMSVALAQLSMWVEKLDAENEKAVVMGFIDGFLPTVKEE